MAGSGDGGNLMAKAVLSLYAARLRLTWARLLVYEPRKFKGASSGAP